MVISAGKFVLLCFRPVLIELPHIGAVRDDVREVIALRSDDGISWHEHPVTASEIVASLVKFAGKVIHAEFYSAERQKLSIKAAR